MKKKILFALLSLLVAASFESRAQHFTVSTNAVGYAWYGTLNAEMSVAVGRRYSIHVGGLYNNWSLSSNDPTKMNFDKQRSLYAGLRFWPWYVYSGWWGQVKLRYAEYNSANPLYSKKTDDGYTNEMGDRFGAGISAGYTIMISPHFNLDFGVGFWAGMAKYSLYSFPKAYVTDDLGYCPTCGRPVSSGSKFFFLPNDITVSLVYVF